MCRLIYEENEAIYTRWISHRYPRSNTNIVVVGTNILILLQELTQDRSVQLTEGWDTVK